MPLAPEALSPGPWRLQGSPTPGDPTFECGAALACGPRANAPPSFGGPACYPASGPGPSRESAGHADPRVTEVDGAANADHRRLAMTEPDPKQQPSSVELARAAFELSGDAFFWMRSDARFVLVNQAACDMLGYSRNQLLEMSVFDIDAMMTPAHWLAHWEELEARRTFTINSFHRRADGSRLPVEVSVNYLQVGDDYYNCARVRDLSAIRAQQIESERNAALKTATIDCALDCVITIDQTGAIVEFNPAAEQTFGYEKDLVVGQRLADLIIPENYRAAHEAGLRRYLDTGEGPVLNTRLELTALRSDGTEFPVELAISPIEVDGQALFTAYLRDITERRAAEQELNDARAAAERASQYKSRFLAGMSHEIRTPLTAIVGYADLLTQPRRNETSIAEWGARIQDNTRYLLSLVNDILDLSKIEAGEFKARPVRSDLLATVREVESMFRARANEKLLDFRMELPTALPRSALFDATRLKQIVVNLLSNAIKATSQGHIALRVVVSAPDSDNTATCEISVSDTGIGIPEEHRDLLFKPFVQLQNGATSPLGGTGLGLAICKNFAKLLGGSVSYRSNPGEGSTFQVDIPLPQASDYVDPSTHTGTARAIEAGAPDLDGARILIVDDNPDNRQILRYLLEPTGAEIVTAASGPLALDLVTNADRERAFDMILLDMQMPEMTGYEVVREMRAAARTERVIAVTAYATAGDRDKCLAAGCDDYLSKPVDPHELYKLVSERARVAETAPVDWSDDPVFAQLRQGYIASLREVLAEIETARSQNDTTVLQRIAHRLKGTGTSYGYPELSENAARCETGLASAEPMAGVTELAMCIRVITGQQPPGKDDSHPG
ncbi:MAG: PAS domain S-box protein [bacterium]|nr:PAS domain S-box protein [bacterium]